jgi:type II secretory pathway predicted ATPase ExeA
MMDIEEFRRKHWGLERVLFSTSPPERRYLDKVFTGRAEELEMTRVAIREAPRRVLVSGTFGIGKTVFIYELLARLGQHYKAEVLTVYDSVNIGPSDLPTAILRALARILKDEDQEARNVDAALSGLEITTERERELGAGAEIAGIGGRGTLTDTTTRAFKSVTNAAYHIQRLIENATQRKPDRRLIVAVDDLDKRDPETIRQALLESRSILHLGCSYVLTGHPLGVLRDAYSTAGGVFDKTVDLQVFPPDGMVEIMQNYLAAGRVKRARVAPLTPFTEATAHAIANRSFGIPRVLNVICFHLLEEAGRRRLPVIDLPELQTCWQAVGDDLRRGIKADLRNLLETLQESSEGFIPSNVPDEVFIRLNVDSYPELIAKLNEAVRSDWVVNVQGRYYPQPLTMPLDIPPQMGIESPEPPAEADDEGESSEGQKDESRGQESS